MNNVEDEDEAHTIGIPYGMELHIWAFRVSPAGNFFSIMTGHKPKKWWRFNRRDSAKILAISRVFQTWTESAQAIMSILDPLMSSVKISDGTTSNRLDFNIHVMVMYAPGIQKGDDPEDIIQKLGFVTAH